MAFDPNDPLTIDETPLQGDLERHPHIIRLRREIARLRSGLGYLVDLRREMVNRGLVVSRNLEPVNPAPPGTINPVVGFPIVVHIDYLRILLNRHTDSTEPTIRILVAGRDSTDIRHCHELKFTGPSNLIERLHGPLPHRAGALTTLETWSPVEVIR